MVVRPATQNDAASVAEAQSPWVFTRSAGPSVEQSIKEETGESQVRNTDISNLIERRVVDSNPSSVERRQTATQAKALAYLKNSQSAQ